MAFAGAPDIDSRLSNTLGIGDFEIPRNYHFQRLSFYGSEDLDEHIPPEHMPQNLKEVVQLEHSYAINQSSDDYDDDDSERSIFGRDESKSLLFKKEIRKKSKFPFSLRNDPDSSEDESIPLKTLVVQSSKTVQTSKKDNSAINEFPNIDSKDIKLFSGEKNEVKDVYNDNLLSLYLSRIDVEKNKINFTKELKIVIKDCKNSLNKLEEDSLYTLSKLTDKNTSKTSKNHETCKTCTQKSKNEIKNTNTGNETSLPFFKLKKKRKVRKNSHFYDMDKDVCEAADNRILNDSKEESHAESEILSETESNKKNNNINKKFSKRDKNSTVLKVLKRRKASPLSESSVSPMLMCSNSELKLDEKPFLVKKRRDSMPSETLSLKESSDSQIDINDAIKKQVGLASKNVKCQVKNRDLKCNSRDIDKIIKDTFIPTTTSQSNEKTNNLIENHQNEKKKKSLICVEDSFSDCKMTTPEKMRESVDFKDSTLASQSIFKSHKKKVVKRDTLRFVINEDEPPLFSSPDMMVKVNMDELLKKEVKKELLDIHFNTIEPRIINDSKEGNNIELENLRILDYETVTVKEIKFEEINFVPKLSNDKSEEKPSIKNNFEMKSSNITPLFSKSEFENYEEKYLSGSHMDMDLNETNNSINEDEGLKMVESDIKDKILDANELNYSKQNRNNAVKNDTKPERKSRRLIKKKEFFEFVSEPPPLLSLKRKHNVQKQQSEKSKESLRKSCSDTDENSSSEDDPDKLWCICRKPHNNRFMIQCDTCEDWFHGTCVGVTKQQGYQLEKQKKDWICPNCRSNEDISTSEKISNNKSSKETKKAQIVFEKKNVIISKTKQKLYSKESLVTTNISDLKVLKSNDPISRSEIDKQNSVVEDAVDKKLKAMKKKLQEEIVVQSKKAKKENCKSASSKSKSSHEKSPKKKLIISPALFSHSKKSIPNKEKTSEFSNLKKVNKPTKMLILSSQSTTTKMKTLSKVKEIKVLPKKHQSCIQCNKPTVTNSCYCSTECIEKHVADCLKNMRDSTCSSKDLNLLKLVVFDRFKGNVITGDKGPTVAEIVPWLKENPSFMIACSSTSIKKESSFKKECDSSSILEQKDSSKANDLNKTNVRVNVKKTLKNILMDRCKNSDDIILPEEDIRKIAVKIEEELYAQFKDTNLKYRTKYRSLMFNIKDPRNQGLFRKILRGEIPPEQVVHMSATELASVELSKWREQEMQHHLDMIKRVQLEHQKSGSTLHLKKTHKGEVEIEDDFTTIIEQDILKTVPKSDIDSNVENDKEEQEAANDTTQLHRSHLFDLNCKICTGKVAPPPDDSTSKKVRIAHSISVDHSSPNTIESHEKAIIRVVEDKSAVSSTADDSLDQEPSSTVSIGSPDVTDKESSSENVYKPAVSVWKGFIFMQDIAKFVTSAYKVSGQTDRLQSDLPDTIQVCGRIIPDQVWDYLSKIKQSGNKELIIIQFQAANEEEALTYNTFYSYLNCRKRYGVVSNYSKKIKDFYIVPLAATSPVPTVLMPFDGPGLPSPRRHLLLGVIVRHKVKQICLPDMPKQTMSKVDTETTDGSYTPPIELRSYTPPLPTQTSEDHSPEIETDLIYNSPVILDAGFSKNKSHIYCENKETNIVTSDLTSLKKEINLEISKETDDDKPYDPEQDVLSLTLKRQDENLKIIKNKEKSPVSENLKEHKKILDALTKQVEKTDREVSALKHFVASPKTTSCSQSQVDVKALTETGMTSFLDLPINLQEILNTVRLKSTDKEVKSDIKGDVDMRKDNFLENKVSKCKIESLFNLQNSRIHSIDNSLNVVDEKSNSLGATPPPPDDEKSTIAFPADPRIKLRTSYQDALFNTDRPSSNYSQIPVLDHVDNIKKPLKENESLKIHQEGGKKSKYNVPRNPGRLLPHNWNYFREPPPPGIEPSELSSDIYSVKAIKASDASTLLPPPLPPPPPPQYASPSLVPETVTSGFPPPAISFPAHIPAVFPVHPPPPLLSPIKTFQTSNIAQSSFVPPPLPVQNLRPEGNAKIMQDHWSTLQSSGYQPEEREWNNRASHWNDNYQSEIADYHHEQGFSREKSSNKQWEQRCYSRNHWHKHSHRGHKFNNRRSKRGYSYRKNYRN